MSKCLQNIFLSYSIIFRKTYNSDQNINDKVVKHAVDALIEFKKNILMK